MPVGTQELQISFDTIRKEAVVLAGDPEDIPQRVAMLFSLYVESKGNHPFPLIALHGALWLHCFFKDVEKFLQHSPMPDRTRKARLETLDSFTRALKEANREVFIDTYTNYFFTRYFGEMEGAGVISGSDVVAMFRKIHAAAGTGEHLIGSDLKDAFTACLVWEQRNSVSPRVKEESMRIHCPVLQAFCLRPVVRFTYFPFLKLLCFKNFADPAERVSKAIESFDIAVSVGWNEVIESIKKYDVMSPDFIAEPHKYAQDLKLRILSHKQVD